MPEKKYLIEIPDMPEGSGVWDEAKWERNKDKFMQKYPTANVFELGQYDENDVDENDQIMLTFDNDEDSGVWDSGKWERNKEAFAAKYPEAMVNRVRYVDYWGNKAKSDEARMAELQQPDEERNAKLAEMGYYDDITSGQVDFSLDAPTTIGLKPLSSAMEVNSVSGETSYLDPKVEEFFASDAAHTERQLEMNRLRQEYDSNPRVIEQREYEAQLAKYAEELEQQIKTDMESEVDVVKASRGASAKHQFGGAYESDQMGYLLDKIAGDKAGSGAAENEKLERYMSALKLLKQAKDARNVAGKGLGAGIADTAKDWVRNNATQSDIEMYNEIGDILTVLEQKVGNLNEVTAEDIDANLNSDEKALIRAFFEYNAAMADAGNDMSAWYKGGKIFAESIPFMMEFLVTGGFASGAGRAATSWMGKGFAKWIGQSAKGTAARAAKKAVAKTVSGVAKTMVAAGARTLVAPSTYKNMAEQSVQYGEDGHLDRGGNMVKAAVDSYIEQLSEMSGEAFSKVLGGAGRLALGKTRFDKIGAWFGNNATMQTLSKLGFHGLPEEIGEEIFGNALRSMTGVDNEALSRMFEKDEFAAMIIGFAPMTLIGAGTSAAQMGAVSIGAANAGRRMRNDLSRSYTEEQIDQVVMSLDAAKDANEITAAIKPVIIGMKAAGAPMHEIQSVWDYAVAVAKKKAMISASSTQEMQLTEAKIGEAQEQMGGRFWIENEDGTRDVKQVVLNNGATAYVVSKPDQDGRVAIINAETGQKGTALPKDIKEESWNGTLNAFGAGLVMADRTQREQQRMQDERAAQINEVQKRLNADPRINVGTEGSPVYLVAQSFNEAGVRYVAQDGSVGNLSWEQVADSIGMPIVVKTDDQIAQEEAEALVAAAAERRAKMAKPDEVGETERTNAVVDAENAVAEEEQITRHIPMNEDGTVNEAAFWEQSPEEYVKWNDEQNQDGGQDSLQQVAIAKQELMGLLQEANAAQNTSNPTTRKAAKKEVERLADRIARLDAIEQSYMQSLEEEKAAVQQTAATPTSSMSEEDLESMDAQYQGILGKTRVQGERVRVMQEYLDKLAEGSVPVVLLTRQNYEEKLKEGGLPSFIINKVKQQVDAGKPVAGFMARGKVYLMEDGLSSIEEARVTYVHERQHTFNSSNPQLVQRVANALGNEESALAILKSFVKGKGIDSYKDDDLNALADEIICRSMEVAYTTEDFSVDLQSRGIPSEVISIIAEIDNEQRQDQSLSHARRRSRRNSHADVSGAGSVREDGRDFRQVPEGVLEQEETRPSGASGRGAQIGEGGEGAEVISDDEEELNTSDVSESPDEVAEQGTIMDMANQDDSGIRFSIRTEDYLEEQIRAYANSAEGKKAGWTEEKIESIIKETRDLINAIHNSNSGNEFYDDFAVKDPTIRLDWRDGVDKPIVTWTRANIEYKYDMSADLLCINNEGLEAVLSSDKMVALMEMFIPEKKAKKGEPVIKFTADDYLELYNTLKDLGFVVPCKGCFDAAGRFKMLPSVAQKFAAEVNAVIAERNKDPKKFDEKLKAQSGEKTASGLPATSATKSAAIAVGVAGDNLTEPIKWTQLMSADGQTKMLSDWGGIFRAWQRTGAGRPKDKLLPEPYYGDIVSSHTTIIGAYGESTPSFRDILVNTGTGLRRNSHSEFRPVLAVDEIQFMRDAFIRNLTVFKYMKELDDVRLFGKMGVKYNMSFFPEFVLGTKAAGLDLEGNYIASEESVGSREFPYFDERGVKHYDGMRGFEEAQKHINKDVSLSSVILSIPHLLKALTDVPTPSDARGVWGSLIPFHSSGATTSSLAAQGLGLARANGVGHGFEEAMYDYGKGVTNFEAVQNDRFGKGWEIISGKKAGTKVEEGHKLEFANGTHYYNRDLGVHLFASGYILDSELPEGALMENGDLNIDAEQKKSLMHKFKVDYNDKVRDLGTPYAYKEAADFYLSELPKIGLIPRFDFTVEESVFLQMCADANVDPRHPKLGWKGEGHGWSPIDSEAYYSLFCDFGMTDPATGEWSPHNPVGVVNENGEREFRLPEDTVEIVREGLERFSEVRRTESGKIDEAIRSFAERSVEKGRISKEDAEKVVGELRMRVSAPSGAVDVLEEAKNAVVNDVMFRFVGEQAAIRLDNAVNATMFMDKLQTAREMEAEGQPMRIVKVMTGWEKGADGKWRHEMPDFEIKAKPGKKKTFKLQDLITDSSLFTEYPQLKDVKVRYKKMASGLMGEVVTEKGQTYINMNDIQYVALNPKYVAAVDAFSQKYPELAEKIGNGGGRNITAEEKQIFVEEIGLDLIMQGAYLDLIGGRETLAHEIQHLIQDYEGFAQGGNSQMVDTRDPLIAKENEALKKLIDAEVDAANAMVPELNDLVDQIKKLRAQFTVNVSLQNEFDQKRREFLMHKANVNYFRNQRAKLRRLGDEGYNRLAGEVEARNVEKRINLSDAERRALLYSDTQDVETEDQIFLRNNLMTDYAESRTLVPGHKKGQPMLSDAEMMADAVSFRITKNTRATIESWCDKAGLDEDIKIGFVDHLEFTFDDATEQLCAAKWYLSGKINLPNEDEYKVRDAVKVAKRNKVDALSYESPMDILNTFGQPKEKVKPINPDNVPTLKNRTEVPGTDIVIYDVEESEESRENMREIINTHYGKNASPWCLLQGNEDGKLTKLSAEYWQRYSAYPKKVAFKGGRLLAFSANSSKEITWWDRQDHPYNNIPVTQSLNDEKKRKQTVEINPKTGKEVRRSNIFSVANEDGYTIRRNWNKIDGPMVSAQKIKDGQVKALFNRYTKDDFATNAQYLLLGRPKGLDQVYTEEKSYAFGYNGALEFYNTLGYKVSYTKEAINPWSIITKDSVIKEYTFNKRGKLVSFFDGSKTIKDRKSLAEVEVPAEFQEIVSRDPKSFMADAEQLIIDAGLADAYKESQNDVSFRITPEQDKAYMDAVEAGDMETAQRMVIEAARLAMPNTKVVDENGEPKVVYHGSGMTFTVFDKQKSDKNNELGAGFYFTDNPDVADLYTRSGFSDNEERYVRRAREIFNQKGSERGLANEYESVEYFDFAEDHLENYGFLDESVETDYEEAFEQAYDEMFSQKNVMPVFLNIRKPYMVEDVSPYNAKELARQQDVDGFIDNEFSSRYEFLRKHTANKHFAQYVVFDPNQIKSATDNTGEYSEGEGDIRYRVVTDPAKIDELENGPKIKVYRAMQLIDGKLYPPMSAKVDGQLREPIKLGQWEEAEERPDLADNKGYFKLDKGNKKSLKARYNPYFHTSYTPLNDQFSEAQDRPNLVIVEVEIPESELSSGYKADKAKDSVGEKEWKAGVIQGKLSGTRKVILSRWDKPVRIVPDSEVADEIIKMFEGKNIVMPSNVVTPSLRAELEKRGVPFVETDNNGKPISEFGPIYEQFRGKPKEAVEFLMEKKTGEAVGALNHKDIGDISIVYGNEKAGLKKIAVKHPEVLDILQDILDEATIVQQSENRIKLESGRYFAVISKDYLGKPRAPWLLTSFEKKNSVPDNTMDTGETSKGSKQNDTATLQDTVSESKDTDNLETTNDLEGNISLRVTGTPTEDVVASGLDLTPAQTAELAGNIFAALPEESRKKITEGLSNVFDLKDAILQIPTSLATKERWNEEDRQMADIVAEQLTKMAGEMTRPFSASEGLWVLYNALNPASEYDIMAQASRALVQRNLGLAPGQSETDGVRFRTVDSFETIDEIVNNGKQKVTDANNTSKLGLITKLNAINASLAQLRSITAAQREYDKATVKIVTDLASELLDKSALSDMTRYEIKRLLSVIKDAVGKKDLAISVERLMDIMIANQLRFGKNRFDEFMKIRDKRVDARGVEVRGRLDVNGQMVMNALREGIELDLERLEEKIFEAEDKLSDPSETVRRNAENDLAGYELARKYLENVKESEIEEKNLRKELTDAKDLYDAGGMSKDAYREFVKTTHDAIRENRMQRVKDLSDILADLAKMITEGVTRASHLREAEKARVERIQHYANSDLQGKRATAHEQKESSFWNNPIVRLLTSPLATFEQWMRIFGQKSAEGKGYLYNHFVGGWNKANNDEYLGIKAAHEELDRKVRSVFRGKAKKWSDLFSIDKKMPTATITMWDDGEMRDFEVTQGNLLYIYMVNKMTDGKMKLRKQGITEADVDAIVRQMDPRFLELADWIQEVFLPGLRDKYNAVHERLFGAPMSAIDNYFPIRVLANARVRDVELGAERGESKPSTITGSIIKRTKNSLALDVLGSNAFDVVLEHIEQMEHWAAFAEFNRDLNTLLSYRKFRNRVQNMSTALGSGKEAWNSFKETAEIVAGVYQPKTSKADKALTNAVRGLTAGKISFRLWTALKQTLSMPAFLPYVSPFRFIKNLATPVKSWDWAMANLPAFQKRWLSREAGNVRLKKTDADWKLWRTDAMEAATRWGMTPNAFVDAVTCSVGAKSVYDTMYARYRKYGYSHDQADEKAKLDATVAFNATQQSSESAFVSAVQSDRTFIAHALTVFRNNSFGMGRELVDALRNTRDRMKKGYKAESIEFMKKQMVRDGLSEDQAERAAQRIYRNGAFKDAARIATFGFIMQFLWNLGGSALYLLFGDDDEEKEAMIKDAAIRGAFGSAEGLGFGNLVPEAMAMLISGDIKSYSPSFSPAGSDLESLWSEITKDPVAGVSDLINILVQAGFGTNPQILADTALAIYDACNGDMLLTKEVGIAVMRLLQAPQSNIDKLIMDEIDFTYEEGLDMTIEEFAKRYADYKLKRNASYTFWAYSDEESKKAEDRYIKRFLKDAEAKKRTMGTEEAKEFYGYYDADYETMSQTLRDLKKGIKEAAIEENIADEQALLKQLDEFLEADEFKHYEDILPNIKAYEAYKNAMKAAKTPEERKEYEQEMLKERNAAVEKLRSIKEISELP